jgi:phosphocarrier protein
VDAKSILGVLTLGVEQGHEIEMQVEGPDEDQAIAALEALIRSNFEGGLG